jgi:hypothetical protein
VASPDAEIAGARSRYWMLRVDTRAGGLGGPSRLPRLHAGWLPARLLFVARGGGPFELAYGNPRAEFNGLRIESVVPGYDPLRNTDYPQASAGEPHPLGGDRRLGVPIDWKTWILWAVLVGGVTALGGMAWRLMRQTSGR